MLKGLLSISIVVFLLHSFILLYSTKRIYLQVQHGVEPRAVGAGLERQAIILRLIKISMLIAVSPRYWGVRVLLNLRH